VYKTIQDMMTVDTVVKSICDEVRLKDFEPMVTKIGEDQRILFGDRYWSAKLFVRKNMSLHLTSCGVRPTDNLIVHKEVTNFDEFVRWFDEFV